MLQGWAEQPAAPAAAAAALMHASILSFGEPAACMCDNVTAPRYGSVHMPRVAPWEPPL